MKFFTLFLLLTGSLFLYPLQDTFDPESGLVAYYSFNECDARDDTGNGSDGVLNGGVSCYCGIEDDGLEFDGAASYVEFTGKVNRYFTTSDLTISFYVRPMRKTAFPQSLLSKRPNCTEHQMLDLQLNTAFNKVAVDFYETPSKYFKELSPPLDTSTWIHFAMVREGNRAFTYINGNLRQESFRCSGVDISNDALLSFSNSPCMRGGRTAAFKGILDELRIYDRVLSHEEVRQLYELHPVHSPELDCYVMAPEKRPGTLPNPFETDYLCAD
jgi:hypothetical protein